MGKQVHWTGGRAWKGKEKREGEGERAKVKKEKEQAENRKPHREQIGKEFQYLRTWDTYQNITIIIYWIYCHIVFFWTS